MPTSLALTNGVIVTPGGTLAAHAVVVNDGRIASVVPAGSVPAGVGTVDVGGAYITPGLIDIHTHGALGRSYGEPDKDAYDTILRFMAKNGITLSHASIPTSPFDGLVEQLAWVRDYQSPSDGAALHGVHLEGPYLSSEDQARGAANPKYLRTPQAGDTARLMKHCDILTMMTIAPELPGALDLIQALSSEGIIMAIGHSSAERADFARGVAAGATHITHLWSGMSNVLRREGGERLAGLIECSLSSGLTAEVIADGHHLPPELIEIARRCLGGTHQRLCGVSDSSIGTGLPEGHRYGPPDHLVEIRNGVANLVGMGRFAGSTTELSGMGRTLLALGWPIAEVLSALSTVPAKVLSLSASKGVLAAGYDADIALFDQAFTCVGTMIGGRWVHEPQNMATQPA